jgi:hypothetical protein
VYELVHCVTDIGHMESIDKRQYSPSSPRSSPQKIRSGVMTSPDAATPSSQEFVSIHHTPGARVMPLNAFMTTNIPGERQRLFKSEWRDRHVVFRKISDGNYVLLIYKSDPLSDEKDTLRQTIALTPSSDILIKNEVLKSAPWFRYIFVIDQGSMFHFALTTETVRNTWATTLRSYIEELRNNLDPKIPKRHKEKGTDKKESKEKSDHRTELKIDVSTPTCSVDEDSSSRLVFGFPSGRFLRSPRSPQLTPTTTPSVTSAASHTADSAQLHDRASRSISISVAASPGFYGALAALPDWTTVSSHHLMPPAAVTSDTGNNYEMAVDGVLTCKFSDGTVGEEGWAEMYCVFEPSADASVDSCVLAIYDKSSQPTKSNRGTLHTIIHFTSSTSVLVKNEVDPVNYFFAIESGGGKVYQFRTRREMARDTWAIAVRGYIETLKLANIVCNKDGREKSKLGAAENHSAVQHKEAVPERGEETVSDEVKAFHDVEESTVISPVQLSPPSSPTREAQESLGMVSTIAIDSSNGVENGLMPEWPTYDNDIAAAMLDGVMDTNCGSFEDWTSRYVILCATALFVYNAEMPNPSPTESGSLHVAIPLQTNTLVLKKNDINDDADISTAVNRARYIFAVESDDVLFQFSMGIEDVRDHWIKTIRKCISRLKREKSGRTKSPKALAKSRHTDTATVVKSEDSGDCRSGNGGSGDTTEGLIVDAENYVPSKYCTTETRIIVYCNINAIIVCIVW